MSDDILLVTVDCWRHDAPAEMPTLRERTADFDHREAVCQAPATRGAFPALLAGQYYPQAYTGFDSLREDIRPLPAVLSDAGYSTGAVIGSNPFLSAWADHFDHFWNDEMDFGAGISDGDWLRGRLSTLRDAFRFATVRSRVPTRSVATRARQWYESQDGPRFLWVHLMDVHVPFLPGLRRGLSTGLLDTYRAHVRFMRDPGGLSAEDYDHLESLYWQSVEHLDEQIGAILDIDPDATTVVVGDHGEEFDHGGYGHARLYEECVRVPLLSSPALSTAFGDRDLVRQLDVPAALCSAADCDVPDSWAVGSPPPADPWPVFMLNHSPQFERVYAGIRTDRYKLIRTFDESMACLRTETYDLADDPGETTDLSPGPAAAGRLAQQLDAFLDRPDIDGGLLEHQNQQSAAVEERLKALGYK